MTKSEKSQTDSLLLGFTTVETREQAEALAGESVERRLAACAQVDAPIRSFFFWQGRGEQADEIRVLFKFVASRREAMAAWIAERHPYDTPEWIVVAPQETSEKYLQWAREVSI